MAFLTVEQRIVRLLGGSHETECDVTLTKNGQGRMARAERQWYSQL